MYKNGTSSLDDVLLVGPGKPVGYKRLSDLKELCRIQPQELQKRLEAMGLKVLILEGSACAMRSGALYAYDERALSAHLKKYCVPITACGWPVEPEAFVCRLAVEWAPAKTVLYDIIADAFGDKDNPGRTDSVRLGRCGPGKFSI